MFYRSVRRPDCLIELVERGMLVELRHPRPLFNINAELPIYECRHIGGTNDKLFHRRHAPNRIVRECPRGQAMLQPITRNRYFTGLSKNSLFLAGSSLFADISTEMLYPILPIFLTQTLHANGSAVGLVEGIAQATQNIVQGFSGWLSDKMRRRKSLALAGYLVSAIAKPLTGFSRAWPDVLGARFLDRLGTGFRSAPRSHCNLIQSHSPRRPSGFLQVAVSKAPPTHQNSAAFFLAPRFRYSPKTYRYKPVPVSALAIYHSPRKSLESQLQRSFARQAGGASSTGSRGNPHSSGT
jgi:Major Facilitator Superfamily